MEDVSHATLCVVVVVVVVVSVFVFRNRVSLDSFDCPGTCLVDQAGFELRDSPASDSQVLGLKVCAPCLSCLIFLRHGLSLNLQLGSQLSSWLHSRRTGAAGVHAAMRGFL